MASAAFTGLLAGLHEGGPSDFSLPIDEVRAGFEELLATMPAGEDIVFSDVTLGGVPTLRAASPTADENKALIYFHGGAYVIGSASGYRSLAAEIGRAAGAVTFSPEYRLAPEHPCPAAVEDGLAVYKALLDSGFAAGNIAISGDSAGGGLALATLVKIREQGLPQPSGAFLISPWVDLAVEGASARGKAAADPILAEEGLHIMAAHYLAGQDAKDSVASPLYADLSGLAPVLIQVGSAEILLDDSVRLAGALGAANTPVILEIWPDMVHVWQAFHFMVPEAKAAINRAGALLAERMGEE